MAFSPQSQGLKVALIPADFPDIPRPTKYDLHHPDGRQQYEEALDQWYHQLKDILLHKLQLVKDSH